MDQMTQQNAAMVEESTAASHSLASEAQQLSTLIGRFRTGQVPTPIAVATRKPAGAAKVLVKPSGAARISTHGNLALNQSEPDDGWKES